ncbi:LysM peptidoglycan-binding domain-containing protein [Quadrisphaera sp. INWT6]|uniref:LysM peptidoglycan-binding domain-containing protein n=1 Tax=Quadrisphaera sp. INWT6 TaxID=2596917 RepID=UPI0018920F25|nr:hypothetical protein [Quadrisphaera sp. INWT6]MBF5080426.1 hypothetical protein [Quadrisphaera sp. INWT6]
MEARAWRLAGGSAVALLVLVALVAWRADSLAGGWLLALRLTGLLAVAGLLSAVVLGSLAALRPPTAPSVVVSVPAAGAPRATPQPGRRALVSLKAVLLLAVLSAAPVLAVLVLATAPEDDAALATGDTSSQGGEPAATPSTAPATEQPTEAPSSAPASQQPTQQSTDQATQQSTQQPTDQPESGATPPPSPAQLPSDAAAQAVCEQVVVSGDSLWSVAAGQLGEGATDADVDARWRALYERNADAVGPDPDLVRPGLVLRTCS